MDHGIKKIVISSEPEITDQSEPDSSEFLKNFVSDPKDNPKR